MPDSENPFVNRSAVVARPKQKLIDWVQSLDWQDDAPPTVSEIKEAPTLFLVNETETGSPEEIREIMEEVYQDIAIEHFSLWWLLDEDWPELNTLEEFEDYFSWELFQTVVDLAFDEDTEEPIGPL